MSPPTAARIASSPPSLSLSFLRNEVSLEYFIMAPGPFFCTSWKKFSKSGSSLRSAMRFCMSGFAIMLFMACICFATIGLFIIPCICAICSFTFFAVAGSFIALAYCSWISLSFAGSMFPIMPARSGGSPAALTCKAPRRCLPSDPEEEEGAADRRWRPAPAPTALPRTAEEEEEARWREDRLGARGAAAAADAVMDAIG
mmetsp:Transcript_31241/g.50186  ORF Transcript_31241/g.50186 Transcript_31241/m.50186 type:complete len:200 (-) Transcript_31241:104-703(-)